MKNFDTSVPVNTHGWDLVLSLSLATVNRELAVWSERSPMAFRYTSPGGSQPFTLKGRFGPWSIAGGSGQDILLALPILSGAVTVTEQARNALPAGSHDISGAVITIAARLTFLDKAKSEGATELVFSFDEDTSVDEAAGLEALGSSRVPPTLHPRIAAILPDALADCLAAHVDDFHFPFAELAPKSAGRESDGECTLEYAVSGRQNEAGRLLIFYSARPDIDLPTEVSGVFGAGEDEYIAAFSQHYFVDTILKAGLASALFGAQFPLPPGFGLGPVLPDGIGPPMEIDAGNLRSFFTGPTQSEVRAMAGFPIRLLNYKGAKDYALRELSCRLDGRSMRISYLAEQEQNAVLFKFMLSAKAELHYELAICGGLGSFLDPSGLRFANGKRVDPDDDDEERNLKAILFRPLVEDIRDRLSGALSQTFNYLSVPIEITALHGKKLAVRDGYLNGGMAIHGEIQEAPPTPA